MSLAKVVSVKSARKEWKCGKCGDVIPVGGALVKFSVGFRGYQQVRCSKSECFPKPSERESSLVSEVYAAQEGVDFSTAETEEDFQAIMQDVIDACESVCSQYEENPMYDNNYDMQERADQVRSAGEELENWVSDQDWEEIGDGVGGLLDSLREDAQNAVNDMDLP